MRYLAEGWSRAICPRPPARGAAIRTTVSGPLRSAGAIRHFGDFFAEPGDIDFFRHAQIQNADALAFPQLLEPYFATVGEADGIPIAVGGRRYLREGNHFGFSNPQIALQADWDVL